MKTLLSSKTDKIKIITFLLVAYGLPWVFFPQIPVGDEGEVFAGYMMILPTFAIVLGRIICKRKIYGWIQWIYMIIFAGYTSVMILWVTKVISGDAAYSMLDMMGVLSMGLLLGSIIDEQEFHLFKNFKQSMVIYLVFVVLLQIENLPIIINTEAGGVFGEIVSELSIRPIQLLTTESITLFGEEYAWRGCLQERLQGIFGKRMGVVILGIMWELWHMPLWFTVYELSQEKIFASLVLVRILSTVGMSVFAGWAYMKTRNIWLCVLLHGINNVAITGYSQMEISINGNIDCFVLFMKSFGAVLMLLFLFAKEYRKEDRI